MRLDMSFKFIKILIFIGLFAGCSDGVDSTLFGNLNSKSCLDSSTNSCFNENTENLSLGSSVRNISIKSSQIFFNVGGDCNEGGFPVNRIDWHIIKSSDMSVLVNSLSQLSPTTICGDPQSLANSGASNSDGLNNSPGTCVSGKFNFRIKLPSVVNTSHILFLCISGSKGDGLYTMGGSSLNINIEPF
jgi:hypothetical protein